MSKFIDKNFNVLFFVAAMIVALLGVWVGSQI